MRQVTPEVEIAPFHEPPFYVHWTPDGKRLSFWQGNALWTAPAD